MKSAQGYRKSWHLKIFLFLALAAISFFGAKILAILLGSHLGNIPVKLNYIGPRVQEELAFKANYSRFSIFRSGSNFVHQSGTVLAILVEGHLSNIL